MNQYRKYLWPVFCAGLGIYLAYAYLKNKKVRATKSDWFNSVDNASQSNLDAVTTLHHTMHLRVLFSQQRIEGTIEYKLRALQTTENVFLDVKSIDVEDVLFGAHGAQAPFAIVSHGELENTLGSQLVVKLPAPVQKGSDFVLTVKYKTVSGSGETAFSWLKPEQTVGGKHPYMFTQAEPIYARTIFPCQDSPSVKATFSCTLEVEGGLSAYVSGLQTKQQGAAQKYAYFEQSVPIPSYLFAIVAGNLQERAVSDRCAVISEPEVLDASAQELSDLEAYVKALEEYTRVPYLWKAYKIVVLPASFPYGGMENPLLTFASPTIIVGDKSQTGVAIHEIAHSWSGNLVSCKNWESFWLNEGWTVFLELKAVRALRGSGEYNVKRYLRAQELRATVERFGLTNSFSSLAPDLKHDNPDDAFSAVPYNKGSQFLEYIESVVGEDAFRDFATQYFTNYARKSLDTREFLDFLKQHFGANVYARLHIDAWVYAPGYAPAGLLEVSSKEVDGVRELVDLYFADEEEFYARVSATVVGTGATQRQSLFDVLSSDLKVVFLEGVYEQRAKLDDARVQRLEERLALNTSPMLSRDAEIQSKWLKIAIATQYITKDAGRATRARLVEHLTTIGRMKYVRPLYQELVKTQCTDIARDIFSLAEKFYHSIASNMVRQDLKLNNQ